MIVHPTRPPRPMDMSRNYPLRVEVQHRPRTSCPAGEILDWLGWLTIAPNALHVEYWRWLAPDVGSRLTSFLEDLDDAGFGASRKERAHRVG